jgi:hypothetical protein
MLTMRGTCLLSATLLLMANQSPQEVSPALPNSGQTELCAIAGTVTRQDTGEPLESAMVSLEDCERTCRSITVLTGPDGRFLLEGLPAGSYFLAVSKRRFITAEYGQRKPSDPWIPLTLQPGQKVMDLIFKLFRTSVITGRIEDQEGEPLDGMEVVLGVKSSRGKVDFQEIDRVTTNDLGEYRLFNVVPGRYYIAARPPQRALRAEVPLIISPNSSPKANENYTMTYFRGASGLQEATAIVIRSGEEIRGLDFTLRKLRGVKVRGSVVNEIAKKPDGETTVSISSQAGMVGTTTVRNGEFTLQDVPPGSYVLTADWDDGENHLGAHRSLEVGSTDIESMVLTIAPGVDISGRISWDAGKRPIPADTFIFLHGLDEQSHYNKALKVKPEGDFVLKSVQRGLYGVELTMDCAGCFVKSIRFGNRDAMEEGIQVNPGSDAPLELTLAQDGAQINCTVLNSDSVAAGGREIVLLADGSSSLQRARLQLGRTDQNGHFQFKGVAPGEYTLLAFEGYDQLDLGDLDSMKPFLKKGTKVRTSPRGIQDVEVHLIESEDGPTEPR